MKGLKNRVAIATGGLGDLGYASAQRLLEEGCRVALFDLKKAALPAFCLSADGTGAQPQTAGFELVNLKPVEGMPPGSKIYGGNGPRLMELFTPERAALFAAEPDWSAQGSGKYLLLYKEGRLVHSSAYHAFMASARAQAAGLSA